MNENALIKMYEEFRREIQKKMDDYIEMYFEYPKYLVLWEGYQSTLTRMLQDYCYWPFDDVPTSMYGMKLILTKKKVMDVF